jgi:uncharacterized protein
MENAFKLLRISAVGGVWALTLACGSFGYASGSYSLESATEAAAKGDPKAQYFLAVHYAKGEGVPQNDVRAAEYMRQSAAGGYAYAQNDLGADYALGRGVMENQALAATWFRKAAEQGDSLGEYSLGRMYFQGAGVPKDIQEAIKWYRKAAEQNQPDAAEGLGDIYFFGTESIKVDYQEAFKWYQIGARQTNAACLNGLGVLYERGIGAPQNSGLAAEYFRKAADNGYVRAYANLGQLYVDGLHMKEDMVEAYKWFTLGANKGDGVARHYLDEIDLKHPLSGPEKAEAYRRVHEYEMQVNKATGPTKG